MFEIPDDMDIQPIETKEQKKSKEKKKKKEAATPTSKKESFKKKFPCYEKFGEPKGMRKCKDCEVKGTCEAKTARKQRGDD